MGAVRISPMANIMIYGSCVSRDAYETIADDHNLLSYVARQSVISGMSAPTNLLTGGELSSGFQNRMLAGDLASNLLPTIRRHAGNIDLLLIDLTDERLGVHQLPDGSFVTRSTELVTSKRLDQLERDPSLIRIGSERHLHFWSRAAKRFYAGLDVLGLRQKTLIVNTPWAHETFSGASVDEFRQVPTDQMNMYFNAYADVIRSLGYNVVDMPPALAVSTANHRWGAAPYHYGAPAYAWIRDEIYTALK